MKKIVLIVLATLLFACSDSSKNTRLSVLMSDAKEKVFNRLKSPSSAKFFDEKAKVIQLRNNVGNNANGNKTNTFAVKLKVDAKNAFGVDIRKTYTVIYEYNGTDSLNITSYKFKDVY